MAYGCRPSGYDASHVTVTVKGAQGNVIADLTDPAQDLYVTVDGVTEKTADAGSGLTLTDTLLIIPAIITAVVALTMICRPARNRGADHH